MMFVIQATRSRHAQLFSQLRSSGTTEQVVVFRDSEEE
jgi:hypothetical protein